MKRLLVQVLMGVVGLPLAVLATEPIFRNTGTITSPEQIVPRDASNFVNEAGASIFIFSTLPFDMSNTENYTNKGSIFTTPGWRFDRVSAGTGVRQMASSFHNDNQGNIIALDGPLLILLGSSGNIVQYSPSKLFVRATNVINSGSMTLEPSGLMTFDGKSVNMSRARLQVLPMFGQGTAESVGFTNFIPDTAIYDNYWAVTNINFDSASIIVGFNGPNPRVQSPTHAVTFPQGINGMAQLGPMETRSFVYVNASPPSAINITNIDGSPGTFLLSTNFTIQGAFVGLLDPDITPSAQFFDSTSRSNLFKTVTVELSTRILNPVTLNDETNALYVLDRLASETNRNLSRNITTAPFTYRPASYSVSRVAPIQFTRGFDTNDVAWPTMYFDPLTMSNSFVQATYAAYSATADYLAGRAPAVAGSSISNVPGRIEINADTLDLTRTRVRLDSLLNIRATHLISSSNAVVDTFNLALDLGSTNGSLRIRDLAKREVTRFGGDVHCWSGLWTNQSLYVITENYTFVETNLPPDTNIVRVPVQTPLTNILTIGMHAFIMDARTVSRPVRVDTFHLITRSTNVILNDPFLVTNVFLTTAQSFTIEGINAEIAFSSTLPNWRGINAPNLLNFTNTGTLSIPNEAHFGDDRAMPYEAWVNRGAALGFAAGLTIASDYFENSGSIQSGSLLQVQTRTGKMEDGSSIVGGDFRLFAHDFRLRNYTNQSGGTLGFTITNSLADSGPGSQARLICNSGFQIAFANAAAKPQVGDLLGTTIESDIARFVSVPHSWPGNDWGASARGFTDNLALGRLNLNYQSLVFGEEAFFSGTGDSNGLYVDFLSFSLNVTLDNLEQALRIDPNLTIYFAASSLPEEQLDGMVGGHLRWVRDFAGPSSSIAVLVNGKTVMVNKALRNSKDIDSDNDGIPNYYDATPFDSPPLMLAATVVPQANQSPSAVLAISWEAAAHTVYQVQFTTNFPTANWQLLMTYTNDAATNRHVTVWDTNGPAGDAKRLYRVGYTP